MVAEAEQVAHDISQSADSAEQARLAARYDRLQHELHRHDAYHLDRKIERILDGLGFAKRPIAQSAESLSGGQQNRLLLAKLLLGRARLDAARRAVEPSGHRSHASGWRAF